MHRLLFAASVLVCACGSAPAGSSLAGVWGGPALTNFAAQGAFGEQLQLQVTLSGSTATLVGICGGEVSSIGPGTVDATMGTVGTGTYAQWFGELNCPARRVGRCAEMVWTYEYANVLAGQNTDFGVPGYPTDVNTLSFSGRGTSIGCGITDVFVTSFIGTPAPVP